MRKLFFGIAIACMLLTGCQSVKGLLPTLVQRNPLILPIAAPVEQYPYEWYIVNAENAQEKFDMLSGKTLIGVTPEGFKNLNMSMAELRKYIQEQQAIIDAYHMYYDTGETPTTTPPKK